MSLVSAIVGVTVRVFLRLILLVDSLLALFLLFDSLLALAFLSLPIMPMGLKIRHRVRLPISCLFF
jgi:hypothetical protein